MGPTQSRVAMRRPVSTADHELIAGWLHSSSPAAALSSDVREDVTVEDVRAVSAGGGMVLFEGRDGDPFGVGRYTRTGNPRNYEISLIVGDPALWRSGLGAEAAVRLVDHLFMMLDAHRVCLWTGAFNPYTLPALARSGFVLEGVLRDHYFLDGEFFDATVWGMLCHEHRRLIARNAGGPLRYHDHVSVQEKAAARRFLDEHLAGTGDGAARPAPAHRTRAEAVTRG